MIQAASGESKASEDDAAPESEASEPRQSYLHALLVQTNLPAGVLNFEVLEPGMGIKLEVQLVRFSLILLRASSSTYCMSS